MTEINGTAQFDEQDRNVCESAAAIFARRRAQADIARGNPTPLHVGGAAAKPQAPVADDIYKYRRECVEAARRQR